MTAEADIALNQTFRVELDLLARNPSPTPFPAPLAPVLTIHLRGPCRATVSAAHLTAEVEGQYDSRTNLAAVASGVHYRSTRMGDHTTCGLFPRREAGHTTAIGIGAVSGWFANASLGRAAGPIVL